MYTKANLFVREKFDTGTKEKVTVNRNTYPVEPNVLFHAVKEGESIFTIAYKYFGDFRKFYLIMDHNTDIDTLSDLTPGEQLLIPRLPELKV